MTLFLSLTAVFMFQMLCHQWHHIHRRMFGAKLARSNHSYFLVFQMSHVIDFKLNIFI